MRVDLFLKRSRLVKRRTLAKELCDEGAVHVNGLPARPGKELAPGDRLRVRIWNRLLEIEIKSLPEKTSDVREMYRVVSDERVPEHA